MGIAGVLLGLLAGWIIDALVQPYLGVGLTLLISFVGSTVVFFFAQKGLKDLRGR